MDRIQSSGASRSGRPSARPRARKIAESAVPAVEQSPDRVRRAVPDALDSAQPQANAGSIQTYLSFAVDDRGRVRIKVVNASNDEVIREIPAVEQSRAAAALRAHQQATLRRLSAERAE